MVLPMNDVVTRMLLMRRRGLERSEALKYSVVLSAADSTPALTATDAVVTDLVARRRAEQSAAPVSPAEVQSREKEAWLAGTVRDTYDALDQFVHARGSALPLSMGRELLHLLLILLQLFRDPAGQQVARRLSVSRNEVIEGVQDLLEEVIERFSSPSEIDENQRDTREERDEEARRAPASKPHASFVVRAMRASEDSTAVEVHLEDTSVPKAVKNRTWDFGNGIRLPIPMTRGQW